MFFRKLKEKKTLDFSHIECPNCENTKSVDKWNTIAKDTYGPDSPDVRVASLDKKISFPFQCPDCYMAFSAHQLKFTKKDMPSTNSNSKAEVSEA
ncbi:hypothetical protein EBO34_12820 [Alteribacter keqinensis]|uniref:Uncharacterized protein n=1 Tax=Alteribacter keqinensis TaxID=2483800 RepID=A0A3M7TQB4_9BACI|nr:hypothetical protein EBO34_12820 [Alteribacter keqinensis]